MQNRELLSVSVSVLTFATAAATVEALFGKVKSVASSVVVSVLKVSETHSTVEAEV